MANRQASLLVADEIYFNLFGKATLQGIYHNDLGINVDPSPVPQLIFFFMAETDAADPFHSFAVEVALPGADSVRQDIPVIPPQVVVANNSQGKKRLHYRHPLLITRPLLRPGEIKAKVTHEKGEIVVSAPWITLAVAT